MTMPTVSSEVHTLDHEQLASDAQRLTALFDGAVALLVGGCPPSAVHTARGVLLESRALVASITETLEGLAARKAEADRAERAHRAESARVATALPAGGLR